MKESEINFGPEKAHGFESADKRFTALVGEQLNESQITSFLQILNSKGFGTELFMNCVEILIEDSPNEDIEGHLKALGSTSDPEEFKDKALEIIALVK